MAGKSPDKQAVRQNGGDGQFIAGVLRGNTIRGNRACNSERKMHSERGSERASALKISENL